MQASDDIQSEHTPFTPETFLEALSKAGQVIVNDPDQNFNPRPLDVTFDEDRVLQALTHLGVKWGDFDIRLTDTFEASLTWDRGLADAAGDYIAIIETSQQKFRFGVKIFRHRLKRDYNLSEAEDLPRVQIATPLREVIKYKSKTLEGLLDNSTSITFMDKETGKTVTEELGEDICPWYEAIIEVASVGTGSILLPDGNTAVFYKGDVWANYPGGHLSIVFKVGDQYFKTEAYYPDTAVIVWEPLVEVYRKVQMVQSITYPPVVRR